MPTEMGQGAGERRYDVDWLRTIAIGLLIVFHVVLCFMPWAAVVGFPQHDPLLEELIPFVSLLTVWRIPILFLISGMGVRFAMERRNWKELLIDRTVRIMVPYVFGILVLNMVLGFILPRLGWDAEYFPNFSHLWFLLNIFLYFVWLFGLMIWMKDKPDNAISRFLERVIRLPLGLFLFALPLVLEAAIVNPQYFALYVDTLHGWLFGLICFAIGFVFASARQSFWTAAARTRWSALIAAIALFLVRGLVFKLDGPNALTALESMSWMLAFVGFGSVHLNRPSRGLGYFSRAVYPLYFVHMPVQFVIAYYLLPLGLSAYLNLAIMLVGTFGISLLLYELLRRLTWIRPLVGMKLKQR